MKRPGMTHDAILLWRRKRRQYSSFCFLTAHAGVIVCHVPHNRLRYMKRAGSLQPFARLFVTIAESGGYREAEQIDPQRRSGVDTWDPETAAYLAFVGVCIEMFFSDGSTDARLFHLTEEFARAIAIKPVDKAVVIFGWQLMHLAGFLPTGEALHGVSGERVRTEIGALIGRPVSADCMAGIEKLTAYRWERNEPLQLERTIWDEAERTLFAYAEAQAEREIPCLRFLRDVRI